MNYELIKQTFSVIIDELVFNNDTSIFNKTKEELKTFLNENTSITDDEKARIYADFLKNMVIAISAQATSVSIKAPLQEAQIDSIKVDDKVKENEVAIKIAKTKYKINNEIQAEVDKNNALISKNNTNSSMLIAEAEKIQEVTNSNAKNASLNEKIAETLASEIELCYKKTELEEKNASYTEKKAEKLESEAEIIESKIVFEGQKIQAISSQEQYEKAQKEKFDTLNQLNESIEENYNDKINQINKLIEIYNNKKQFVDNKKDYFISKKNIEISKEINVDYILENKDNEIKKINAESNILKTKKLNETKKLFKAFATRDAIERSGSEALANEKIVLDAEVKAVEIKLESI